MKITVVAQIFLFLLATVPFSSSNPRGGGGHGGGFGGGHGGGFGGGHGGGFGGGHGGVGHGGFGHGGFGHGGFGHGGFGHGVGHGGRGFVGGGGGIFAIPYFRRRQNRRRIGGFGYGLGL
ncbi:unnamed protein product [Tenebrio molitor]|nr:unnamed protein product [Tenebrio molitor]